MRIHLKVWQGYRAEDMHQTLAARQVWTIIYEKSAAYIKVCEHFSRKLSFKDASRRRFGFNYETIFYRKRHQC